MNLTSRTIRALNTLRAAASRAYDSFWVSFIQGPDHDPDWFTREAARSEQARIDWMTKHRQEKP